jgi:OmpA-OmpF porin, OOP family
MKKVNFIVSLFCLSLALSETNAQVPVPKGAGYEGPNRLNTWAISVTPAITQFYGDLRQYDFGMGTEEHLTGGLGIGIHKQISPIFGISTNFWTGNLNGSKARIYNAHFESKGFLQGTVDLSANLKPLLFGYDKLKRWKWDAHVGYGYMWFNTVVYQLGTNKSVELLRSNTRGSSKTAGDWEGTGSTYTREIVIPAGISFHYEVSPRIDVGFDYTINNVNTEKLDMTYGDETDAQYKSQSIWLYRKGDSKPDKWGSFGLSLTYKLGKDAVMAKKGSNGDWVYDAKSGRYHLRYSNPNNLVAPPYNPTMKDADSIVAANQPKPLDPRLFTDSDGDGVADLFDKEPGTPANSMVSGSGLGIDIKSICNNFAKPGAPVKDECEAMFGNVECDNTRAGITPASQDMMKQIVELLNLRPNCRVVLVGHADPRDKNGLQKSKQRVDAAKKFLIRNGLKSPERITTEYYGGLKPLSADGTASRCIDIKILPDNTLREIYPAGFRTGKSKETGSDQVAKEGVSASGVSLGCGSAANVFENNKGMTPRTVTRLGANPEFGNVRGITTQQFYSLLKENYGASDCDRKFLDSVAKTLGFKNGFAGMTAADISEDVVTRGSVGNLGYGKNHQTQYSKMEADPLDAFKITGKNGKVLYFMKTCGNHFYPAK